MLECATAGYRWATEAEEWSAAFEYRELIERMEALAGSLEAAV